MNFCLRRLTVRTPGFHPGNRSSILLGDATQINQYNMEISEKQRMEAWQNLSEPKPSWESFKRMMPMFKNDASVVKAMWLRNVEKNQPVNT